MYTANPYKHENKKKYPHIDTRSCFLLSDSMDGDREWAAGFRC